MADRNPQSQKSETPHRTTSAQEPAVPRTDSSLDQGEPRSVPSLPSSAQTKSPKTKNTPSSSHEASTQAQQAGTAQPVSMATSRVSTPEKISEQVRSRPAWSATHGIPPWLISASLHLTLLIILGFWVLSANPVTRLTLEATVAERLGERLDDFPFDLESQKSEEGDPIMTPEELLPVDDPLAAPPETQVDIHGLTSTSSLLAPTLGVALNGREEGMKETLLAAYGGDAATELAVLQGLRWLAKQQRRDGLWSLQGPYPGGTHDENLSAATAMALLAFQGAGHTHRKATSTQFQPVVRRGWNTLLKRQDVDGNFFLQGPMTHRLYTQAQCTIALCELYGMTRDSDLLEPAQRAVNYCVQTQGRLGGWRYDPKIGGSDTSVTGWFVMALASAKMAGLYMPEECLRKVSHYLDLAETDGGRRYLYQPGAYGGLAMTAEGLFCRQLLGWMRNDLRLLDGVSYLTDNLMDWNERNVYYWYYATQVCHHMEDDFWRQWNAVLKKLLPEKQIQQGQQRGSWDPDGDRWGFQGGRLYVTCLSIYMLEVYYRHLPIYQHQLLLDREQ